MGIFKSDLIKLKQAYICIEVEYEACYFHNGSTHPADLEEEYSLSIDWDTIKVTHFDSDTLPQSIQLTKEVITAYGFGAMDAYGINEFREIVIAMLNSFLDDNSLWPVERWGDVEYLGASNE